MSFRFHWGGQVSADIQAQNQMLFDAMAPEQQQQVLAAQAERATAEAEQRAVDKEIGRRFVIRCVWVIAVMSLIGFFAPAVGALLLLVTQHMGVLFLALAGLVCLGLYEVLKGKRLSS